MRPAAKITKIICLITIASLGFHSASYAQADGSLAEDISKIVAKYEKSSKATVGLSVVDLRQKDSPSVISHRGLQKMIPASNQKIVTSIAAITRLGGDFKFRTTVFLYDGNICLAGDCDPTLGDPVLAKASGESIYKELDAWAIAIGKKVGKTFSGDIIAYANETGKGFLHPDWKALDTSRWYGSPVAALGFHNNCYDVSLRVTGAKITAIVNPSSSLIRIDNRLRISSKHLWSLRPSADESVLTLRGTVKCSSEPLSVPMINPPRVLGMVLADRLAKAGITFTGRVRHLPIPKGKLAGSIMICESTTPLPIVMARANKRSLNLAAECLFLRAGNGLWARSQLILTKSLTAKTGLDKKHFVLADGSGLSRKNRISPYGMTKLLTWAKTTDKNGEFISSLPLSGVDGTLKKRLSGSGVHSRIRAKTGYIYGVCCLSGYVLDAKNKPVFAFSILVNDVPGGQAYIAKQMQDEICTLLAKSIGD